MASGGDFAAEVTWRQLGPVLTEYFPHDREGTRGLKIVEVGCGMGELSFLMQEAGHTVVAIDPCAEAIAATRKKGVTDARQCSLEDLAKTEEERGTFDVVLFTRSLHHIGEDLEGVLRMVRDQLLRRGGVLVIEEFGREDIDRPTAEWYYALHDSLVAAGAIDATTRHHHHQSPEKGEGGADRNNNEEEDEAERRARRRRREEEREVLDRWARQFRWSHHGMVGIADLHLGREMVAAVERVFGHIRVERKPVLFRFIANHVDRKLGKEEEDKKSNKAYEIARNVWRWEERMIYESKAIRPLGILGIARKPAH